MFRPYDITTIAALVLIAFVHRQIAKNGTFFLVLTNLPITIMHEMAHYMSALLLGGKPTRLSLWPKLENGRWRLGSVTARATLLSAAPTALAPLLWLVVGWLILPEHVPLTEESLPRLCVIYPAAYICIAASMPSWQDIKVAITHPLSLIIWSVILIAADYMIG